MILTPTPKKIIKERFDRGDDTRWNFEEGKSIDMLRR
jgi:hypothetical protein